MAGRGRYRPPNRPRVPLRIRLLHRV